MRFFLRELQAGKALGAQLGFVESWNHLVRVMNNITGGLGIEIECKGDHWIIKSVGKTKKKIGEVVPDEGGGGGLSHIWEDPTIAFGLTKTESGYTMRGGVLYLNKAYAVGGCNISEAGYLMMNVRWQSATSVNSGVGVTYSISQTVGIDPDFSGGWKGSGATDHEAHFPLYQFATDSNGLRVVNDYIHSCANMYYFCLDKMFNSAEINVLRDVSWDGYTLQKSKYELFQYMQPKPGDTSCPPIESYDNIFTSEIYEV